MKKLSEIMNKLKEKWNAMSKTRKIALIIIAIVAVLSIGILLYVSLVPKYTVLFSNLESQDSGNIITALDGKGATYKIEGNSILVKESEVDKLRMEILSQVSITEGSKGFELFDAGKVGATDEESRIMYQRALSGEIERTIKGFDEVESAKVNLVLPSDSAFVTTPTPASASVTVKLVQGKTLTTEQVKAIVYLVTGSVENLDRNDVTIVSDNLTLLTEGIFDEESGVSSANTDKQIETTKKVEQEYESKILNVLEPIYRDNVKVSVNAVLNFDAVKQNNVTYDKENGALVSEHNITDNTGVTDDDTSGSPVDNNMSNTQDAEENNNVANGGYYEETKNYENSKKEETVVKAPGQLEKISASVVVNGDMDATTKAAVRKLVADAIGFNEERGDGISVEGMSFNTSYQDQAQAQIDAMKAEEAKAARNKLIALIVAAVTAVGLIIIIIVVTKKKKNNDDDMDEIDEPTEGLDIVVDDDIETVADLYSELNLERENEKDVMMKEVQKYAEKKPEQVAEIVKSWLSEEEKK